MDDVTLIILALLEVIVVLVAALVFVGLKQRKLRQQLTLTPETVAAAAEVLPGAAEAVAETDAELLRLRERVTLLQERIHNLERFKEMFFQFKDELGKQEALIDKLNQELEQVQADDADMTMLRATVEQLACEKLTLQDQVAAMSRELDAKPEAAPEEAGAEPAPAMSQVALEAAADPMVSRVGTVNQSSRQMSDEVDNMRDVVGSQEAKIQEMGKLIGELRLEVGDKDRLKQITAQLEGRAIDLSNAVDRMEQENNFLQDQISTLLQQEISRDDQFTTELQRVEERLASKESAYRELETKYAEMEQQYLDAYNALQRQNAG